VRQVQHWLDQGFTEVVDADLSGYFDSIPHQDLMKCLARRISDGRMLRLVKMWLEAAVEETDETGKTTRSTRNRDEGRGTPQGGVASPLLANLYMRRFVLGWKVRGNERRYQSRIVNYADDFVICCRPGFAEEAMQEMRRMMDKLGLTVNEKKTRQCFITKSIREGKDDGEFTFLGFTFGRQVSWKTNRAYIAPTPARKKIQAICDKISLETSRCTTYRSHEEQVGQLNAMLLGWGNYFRMGYVTGAWRVVQQHACRRFRQWLHAKHGQRLGKHNPPDLRLYEDYGLVKLIDRVTRIPLFANSRPTCSESRMR
jgi:group II intron reverse transcriptase/maturase